MLDFPSEDLLTQAMFKADVSRMAPCGSTTDVVNGYTYKHLNILVLSRTVDSASVDDGKVCDN